LLSHALWSRVFAEDEKLIGQRIKLSNQMFTVVGILPPKFKFPFGIEEAEIWTTNSIHSVGAMGRGARQYQAIARLKPGISLQTAQIEMTGIAGRLEKEHPVMNRNFGVLLLPAQRELTEDLNLTLWLLFGAVTFVLLIACANVVNLQLTRALSRRREMAIRTALGAGSRRIARQLLTESILLFITGGALGLLIAAWGIPLLLELSPQNLPRINAIEMNYVVLGFTLFISILTGAISGLAPALKVTRPDLIESLKEAGKTSTAGQGGNRVRKFLVVGEIAIALMLLIGAGLLINSFLRLNHVELGYQPENILYATLNLSPPNYPGGNERIIFIQQARERIRNIPGVSSVGFTSSAPFRGGVGSAVEIKGRKLSASEKEISWLFTITPDYFATMGIPLLQGRKFSESDDQSGKGVAIINETFARRFFPNINPLGQIIIHKTNNEEGSPVEFEVVGIAGAVRGNALNKDPVPEVYTPYRQTPWEFGQLVIRTEDNPLGLAGAVRRQIRSLDPTQTVPNPNTLENLISRSIVPQRFNLVLLSIFAGIGLLLTLVGIYGVMSYHVSENTREIGLRLALGAQRSAILKLVIGQGLTLALAGIVIGIAGAFGLTRLMESMLFGITPTDPLTFGVIASLFGMAALLACYFPARRATNVDPMVALRFE
jgi:putative ABC transport system permease protein